MSTSTASSLSTAPLSSPSTSPAQHTSFPIAVKIVPRKRKFESRNRRPPAIIFVKDVRALMHLSQREAAEALDVSLTALKSACKKMGVTGWPYTRKEKLAAAMALEQEARQEVHCRSEPTPELIEEEQELMRVYRTWRTGEMLEEVIALMG